jgi:enoyl-CoA hydratase/carnithine racemase
MLKVERDGSFVVWTISRPEAKNALNAQTLTDLANAADYASKDRSVRAVILTGAGGTFASGGDLRELRDQTTTDHAARFADAGFHVAEAIARLHVPVIAAMAGVAFGGGAELAVACDLRIADMSTKISFKQARMGVTTAWGTLPKLVSIVGPSMAARMLYTSHEVSATEAKITRLVDDVVANGTALATAIAWAYDIAQGSPSAIAEMKSLLQIATSATPMMREAERDRFIATWVGADHTEAMNAFFERRAPVWK